MDHFGSVSNGLDRAQLDVSPASDEVDDPRPPPEALQYRKPSIRHAIKDNFLSTIVHSRFGVNKIKAAINEKHDMINGGRDEESKGLGEEGCGVQPDHWI